jgi:catechol 2,3-dioxygenase-like lactoylglutathione lyase family enzyme
MPIQGPGITHVCYQVASTSPIYAQLNPAGAKIISRGDSPVDLGGYGIYYTYFRDIDCVLVENEQMDKPFFTDKTWVGHVAIACQKIDSMLVFYTKLLGKETHRRSTVNYDNPKLDAIGDIDHIRLKGAWIRLPNMIFEFWEYQNPKPSSVYTKHEIGYSQISIEVKNIHKAYGDYKNMGFKIVSKLKNMRGESYFEMHDLEGNSLKIIQLDGRNSLKNKKVSTEK